MKKLNALTLLLIVIGGLNWGLIGLFGFNLVSYLFGGSLLAQIIYILVGLSALYQLKPCLQKCTG